MATDDKALEVQRLYGEAERLRVIRHTSQWAEQAYWESRRAYLKAQAELYAEREKVKDANPIDA